MNDPAMRVYRKRMQNIWHERNNAPQTEQRLADQIREREEIERQLVPNEMREDQKEQVKRPNSQDEDSHGNTPTAASYEAEGNAEYLDKVKEWMHLGSERSRISSLKCYIQKNLKEKTKEVNDILGLINTNNNTETNSLAYAGARLAVELMEIKIPQNNPSKRQQNHSP